MSDLEETPVVGTPTMGTKISINTVEYETLQEVPELGGDPEKIDTTTLTDTVKKSIPGVKDLGDLTFKFLYDKTEFLVLAAVKTSVPVVVTFADGMKATFKGIPNVKMGGAAVNGALVYSVGFSLQSDIAFT